MGANSTSSAGGSSKAEASESPTSAEQDQYIKQYMRERAIMYSLQEGQAIHYNTDAALPHSASGGMAPAYHSTHVPAVFKWQTAAKEVYVSGSWDNWKQKQQLRKAKDENEYFTIVELAEGDHSYKFWVDGFWKHNPNEPTIMTETGALNNTVTVRRADFEVMDALESDAKDKQRHKSAEAGYEPGTWCQEVPEARSSSRTTPPLLPPALLQVMLNKDIPKHLEPTLLPEPNHIMLSHLYALSIKDGVMVLSNTHRFRKKYVTTLLYKPI